MVDISKIAPGDEVTVRGRVSHLNSRSIAVCFGGGTYSVEPARIVSHTRKLAMGDAVTFRPNTTPVTVAGTVLHVYGDHAWVFYEDGGVGNNVIKPLANLERVDG